MVIRTRGARAARESSLYRVPNGARGAEREPIECAIDSRAQESTSAVESAESSFSATAGSSEVIVGDPNAWSSRCTRIEPLPRPKRSTWRGTRADRVRDRFSCAGEHVRGRVHLSLRGLCLPGCSRLLRLCISLRFGSWLRWIGHDKLLESLRALG